MYHGCSASSSGLVGNSQVFWHLTSKWGVLSQWEQDVE